MADYKAFQTKYNFKESLSYLRLLSKEYPNIEAASEEIINLHALLNLPKGTEHFMSDIHGEYESFTHILKNASGVIKSKIDMVFGNTLSEAERKNQHYYKHKQSGRVYNSHVKPDPASLDSPSAYNRRYF